MRPPTRAWRRPVSPRLSHLSSAGQALDALSKCSGEASLQNVLELARSLHDDVATFISRELILLSASLATCDPGDIHETIKSVVASKVARTELARAHAPRASSALRRLAPQRRPRSPMHASADAGACLCLLAAG